MSPTERLYFEDSRRLEFDASVVGIEGEDGARWIILDRTAFYPEGGGQLADRGQLAGASVLDVQADAAGRVRHLLEGAPPALGSRVTGRVDRDRRLLHRALHTGQHVLSRALLDVVGAETVSARLGETSCTIDVNVPQLDDGSVARAEALANSVVDDDVVVRAWFPEPEELARIPLRRDPKVHDEIRIVGIGDFDFTPCGGTHCAHSSEIGSIRVTGSERYKGGSRVSFAAGSRARTLLGAESAILRGMARELSCAPGDVPGALEKLRRELSLSREALGRARSELAERAAEQLAAVAETGVPVVARLEGASADILRRVATRVTRSPGAVAILAGSAPEGMPVVVARGESSEFDCREFMGRLAARAGGRGGGRPDRAEGRLPETAELEALVRELLA
jgi:alanyl-tRNA synthetase